MTRWTRLDEVMATDAFRHWSQRAADHMHSAMQATNVRSAAAHRGRALRCMRCALAVLDAEMLAQEVLAGQDGHS